jgi:polysaccharide biosynthesis/export protein
MFRVLLISLLTATCFLPPISAQQTPAGSGSGRVRTAYILGPGDIVSVWASGVDEIASDKSYTVSPDGYLDLPLAGQIEVAGKTVEQAEGALKGKLSKFFNDPQISLTVTDFRSQPVSVLGSVKTPGVVQLQGEKRLLEVVSLAGGTTVDADSTVILTRRAEWGPIPLPDCAKDPTGSFYTARTDLQALAQARNPEQNVQIFPNDVIEVPKARMIYVLGEVTKPGGFILHQDEKVSAVQALSMAGGPTPMAGMGSARILRAPNNGPNRQEVRLNLRAALDGKSEDLLLRPEDILYVPGNASKKAGIQALESGLQILTGVVIFRR